MSSKPKHHFGEDEQVLAANAEAVKRRLGSVAATERPRRQVNVRLDTNLVYRAQRVIAAQKADGGRYQNMAALVDAGLRQVLAELEDTVDP